MKRKPKQYFPIRLEDGTREAIITHCSRMKRERSDVTREALELGMGILDMPEYYIARLKGSSTVKIMTAIRSALRGVVP